MPKMGSKVRSAGVYSKEYGETAQARMQDITAFDGLLQDITTSVLRDKVQRFGIDFVNKTADVMGTRFKDMILPQGTRFMRQGTRAAAFAVEIPPSVRTLTFKGRSDVDGIDGVNDNLETCKVSLALPYLYFIPVFGVENGVNVLSAMCVACRTKPLESPNDMLYCINLPNTYRNLDMPKTELEEGCIPGMQQMTICQGFVTTNRSTSFEPKASDFNNMIHQTITHFWSSRFTGELDLLYNHMAKKDKRFKTLKTWEKNSKKDPLFVLDVEYPKAIRLDKLFNDIMELHDNEEQQVSGQVNAYVERIYKEVWAGIQNDENYQKVRVNLNEALMAKFNDAMKRFSTSLSVNLSTINNDAMKKHILLAITISLREAVK